MFGSLLMRWNAFAPLSMTFDGGDTFDASIEIDRYTLETQMLDFNRYRLQAGICGKVRLYGKSTSITRSGMAYAAFSAVRLFFPVWVTARRWAWGKWTS